jgi:site-specific DNA recombinase
MSEETAAPRPDKLSTKTKQLRQRHDELTEELNSEPTMPEPAKLTEIVTHIDQVLDRNQPAQTKTLIEALVTQVKIVGPNQVIPMFRIPQRDHSHDHSDTGASGDMVTPLRARDQRQHPVRTIG